NRPPPPPGGLEWLSTDGSHIVDSEGRTVALRGFNDDALLSSNPKNRPIDATDAELMRRSGFDVVRLPIAWSLLEPERGRIAQPYLDRIVATVHMLNRHHLWVVLDMHVGIAWGPTSEIPSWARVPLVPDLLWFPVSHWQETFSPANLAGLSYFWVSQDWQRDFALSWRAVASRLRDDPGLAGYDLYNEPHAGALPPRLFEDEWMWPFYQRMIGWVGAVDPNHLFVVESTLFANFPTEISHLKAPDLVYSPHFYTGSLVVANGAQGRVIASTLAAREREAARIPAPIWVGEVGIDHTQSGASAWTAAVLQDMDTAGIGWAWWQWRQDPHWGVRTEGGRLLTGILAQLASPYLAAAPPGVAALPPDAERGRLRLTVAATHGGPPALVSWPVLTLARPEVSGRCVSSWSWDTQTAMVTIQMRAGSACQVTVTAA
ncbi:MAG: glycoside hydrolase family 5 protein, partial [Candidatus Dormibacterales bacterium]